MRFNYREGTLRDISACTLLIVDSPLVSDRYRSLAPSIWRRLLQIEALAFAVAEDLDEGGEIVAMGMSVFVTPQCARECVEHPRPGLAERVLLGCSDPLPVLGPPEIAMANSGLGLDAVTLHHDLAPRVREGDPYLHIARNMMMSWCEFHTGHRLSRAIAEGYGEREKAWILEGGTQRLITEYEEYYRSVGEKPPPPAFRPHLVVSTREDALTRPSGALAGAFLHQPPRFYFAPRERRLLERAVRGDTDAQLCTSLGISAAAVKKRWAAAYARVLEIAPEFFGPQPINSVHRGPEKRHVLIEYIRHHPEEMRPHLRPGVERQPRASDSVDCGSRSSSAY